MKTIPVSYITTMAVDCHTGPGINPTGAVPLEPDNTMHYENGTSSADGVYITSHECLPDNSCFTTWSTGQIDRTRSSEEGEILQITNNGGGNLVL